MLMTMMIWRIVSAPAGTNVPCRVIGGSGKGFDVEFTPKEAGLISKSLLDRFLITSSVNGPPLKILSRLLCCIFHRA